MTDRTEPTTEELAALSMPADIKEMSRRHHLEAFFHALWDEAQRLQRNHSAARLRELEAIEVCRSQSAEYEQQTGLPLTGDQQ